mgnify:CR=1 FL=1
MREFKFRAWDGCKMCAVKALEFTENEGIVVTKDDGYFGYTGSDLRLMQSTGLKDKNGWEIWAGDIVEIRYMNPLTNSEVVERYKIEKAESTLYEMRHSSGELCSDRSLFLAHERVEVIGNIFEHPELLK